MLIRPLLLAGGIFVSAAASAAAQTVVLQPEEQVIVREYIVKQPHQDVVLPDDFDLSVGQVVPGDVMVSPLDAPGLEKRYEYMVVDGRGVLVDPETREVVEILD